MKSKNSVKYSATMYEVFYTLHENIIGPPRLRNNSFQFCTSFISSNFAIANAVALTPFALFLVSILYIDTLLLFYLLLTHFQLLQRQEQERVT